MATDPSNHPHTIRLPRQGASARVRRCVESAAMELRLAEARAFVGRHAATGDILIVGATRGAVDDLARTSAAACGASLGLHRFSVTQLAARLAAPVLAAEHRAPATYLGSEAVAARAAFEAERDGALDYFLPVSRTPGFPRALARTLQDLRLAGVLPGALAALPLGGADLSVLLETFDAQFTTASATDRAALLAAATSAIDGTTADTAGPGRCDPGFGVGSPLLLLDVAFDSAAEVSFLQALIDSSPEVLITVPFGDLRALERIEAMGIVPEVLEQVGDSDLVALRRYLFARRTPPPREPRGDVRFFSAPGEGRECIEIARRLLEEARAGVPFDQMAVLLRSPQRYTGLLQHALNRAGIPAWFDRGTLRPHPAGRAFLAMLACAGEKLSARRFAEYLSLAQVPQAGGAPEPPVVLTPADGAVWPLEDEDGADEPALPDLAATDADDTTAVVDGALRAPWKWETLIVESAVIGGDPARWDRRLRGLEQDYRRRLREEENEDPESAQVLWLRRELDNLRHLRHFAMPVVTRLASWPASGTWGEWLDRFGSLAPVVLRQPNRVLQVIAELRPMSGIGPVTLDEARAVIADRLSLLEEKQQHHRYGRVFVASPEQARGRTFRVVFVPGLAERMFPQKPHEDPMLLDAEMRVPLAAGLPVQVDRGRMERLLLRLAVGAPTDRLWLSYPRIEAGESRPRVPSFYALDVVRAITGRIPNHEELQERAAAEGGAGLAWPAPEDPARAIDDQEHDLAVLRQLIVAENPSSVRGHAHYLLRLNEPLKRSITARWARGRSQWTPFDGITRVTGMTRPLLEAQRLGARAYSLSALQKFTACPYQFLLSSVYRLEKAEEPEPLQKLNPRTRGSLFHDVQARYLRELLPGGSLAGVQDLPRALAALDGITAAVAEKYRDDLAPAIDRVWEDEIADIARDLRVWAHRRAAAASWRPRHVEYGFGLTGADRDPESTPQPVVLEGRFKLRGAVDLIEQDAAGLLRITDHKTGRNRTTWKTVIGGGGTLQPVLYGLAVEQALGGRVTSGRLFYCTAAGGFTEHEIPLNDATRRAGLEALEIVDRALELGFLPAAPAERACTWCDFKPVCGPHEEKRVTVKPPEKLGDLASLREMP